MITQYKNYFRIVLVTACLLLIPLVAMQFTQEVSWTLSDFIFMGILLSGAGFTYELISRQGKTPVYKGAVGLAVLTALLLVWVNAAVGIIGNEGAAANLMYFGVLAIGFLGAIITRLQSRGLMWVVSAMAFFQALIPLIAIIIWGMPSNFETVRLIMLNGFFVTLFAGLALLFKNASEVEPA